MNPQEGEPPRRRPPRRPPRIQIPPNPLAGQVTLRTPVNPQEPPIARPEPTRGRQNRR